MRITIRWTHPWLRLLVYLLVAAGCAVGGVAEIHFVYQAF